MVLVIYILKVYNKRVINKASYKSIKLDSNNIRVIIILILNNSHNRSYLILFSIYFYKEISSLM
jgi:hypothetical protein